MSIRNSSKRLLVEGDADRLFFEALLREAGFKEKDVWVGPPTEFGAGGRGKGNALHLLPDMISDFRDGRLTHLGLVIDADYCENSSQGFASSLSQIAAVLTPLGFHRTRKEDGGIAFGQAGYPSISVWIMPNNHSDGLLEDWVGSIVSDNDRKLFADACNTVDQLSDKRFQAFHLSKAKVATWLAWQRIPGQPLASVIGNQLFDPSSIGFRLLKEWIKSTFSD